MTSFDNIKQSAKKCMKGVRWKSSVQMYEVNLLRWLASIKGQLDDNTYKTKGFNEFWISERGKMRFIQSVHISERTVQKTLCEFVLKPIIVPKLIYDNSASLKGKGTEFALERLRCHLERHYRKHGRTGGILTIDYHDYFNSIDHKKLLEMLEKCIDNKLVFTLVKGFVNAFDKGLGLGSEVSQIFAIFFPNKIDHYIKEKLKIKGYGRYMDDSYLIHEDIEYLKECLKEIRKQCTDLGIELNEKRTKLSRLDEGFEYLKKRVTLAPSGKVVMRLARKNITKERKRLKTHKRLYDEGKMTLKQIAQSYQSWRGYAKKYNSHNTIKNMDMLYIKLFMGEDERWIKMWRWL